MKYDGKPQNRPTTQSAFTLIELLVVISVIALLVSILLPSLSRARRLAKQTVCKVLLKGYSLATEMYVVEHDGIMMDSYSHLDPEEGVPHYCGGNKLPEKVARCPEDESTEALGRLGTIEVSTDDGASFDVTLSIGGSENALSCSARPIRGGKTMEIWVDRDDISGKPDKLMVWADFQQNNPDSDEPVVKPLASSMGSLCFRHLGNTSNAVFLDGHVGTMQATLDVENNGHDLADGVDWGVESVGKYYKCYYPFGVGAIQTSGDSSSKGDWPGMECN